MSEDVVLVELDRRGVATVRLNRPEVNNAYNDAVISGLAGALERLRGESNLRLVVLRGNGRHFQAGADLAFLRQLTTSSAAENLAFSRATVAAIHGLQNFPQPILALIHGGCFGGGVGMVAACDIAVASEDAVFALTETRWGITPAPVIPALVTAVGPRALNRYALTAERFNAAEALRLGLVHAVCPPGELDKEAEPIIEGILMAAPDAVAATKRLLREAHGFEPVAASREALAAEGAGRRHSAEAMEGLASFAEKRPPRWYPGPKSSAV
ncbi:MAG: enoyl-CoA hydratase/isomerase family protein [Alphaproteobacteria bacterium]|nr:enoyl-CoA hydratase/isomerase family protein [Alphaproteobacteria bacterium]